MDVNRDVPANVTVKRVGEHPRAAAAHVHVDSLCSLPFSRQRMPFPIFLLPFKEPIAFTLKSVGFRRGRQKTTREGAGAPQKSKQNLPTRINCAWGESGGWPH